MQTATDQPTRERKSELYEVHICFQEQGKRLHECLTRIETIGNKLEDSGGAIKEEKPKEPSPRMCGITSDLYNDVDGFRGLITNIVTQLDKLEKHI